MLVRDPLESHELETVFDYDYQILAVPFSTTRLLGGYLQPQPEKVVVRRFLFDLIRLSQEAATITGDFNALTQQWDPNTGRGTDSAILLSHWDGLRNFTIAAPNLTTPTFEARGRSSIVDLFQLHSI